MRTRITVVCISAVVMVSGTPPAAAQTMKRAFDRTPGRFVLSASDDDQRVLSEKIPLEPDVFHGTQRMPGPADESRPVADLVRLQVQGDGPAVLTLVANSRRSIFSVAVYAGDGAPIAAGRAAGPEHRIVIPAGANPSFVEVVFENPSVPGSTPADPGSFTATVRQYEKNVQKEPVANGHVQLMAVRGVDYDRLVTLARCDFADRISNCTEQCNGDCRATAALIVQKTTGSRDAGDEEPIVGFVGASGTNRILMLSTDGRLPQAKTLQRARYVWGAFVEDADAPFETSIDVQFRQRGGFGDYEEFDPAGLVSVASKTKEGASDTRVVRVGFRRFRVRSAPVDLQFTFSRQGPTYGVRQWLRTYRAFARSAVWPVASVVVPARKLFLEEYEVEPRVGPNGEDPTFSIIVPERQNYRVFAALTLTWPRVHDAAFDSESGFLRLLRTVGAPEPQIGLSFPEDGLSAIFTGLSWPLPYRPLRLSAGYTWLREETLRPGLFPNGQVPLATTVKDVIVKKWDHKITVGMSVDFLGR